MNTNFFLYSPFQLGYFDDVPATCWTKEARAATQQAILMRLECRNTDSFAAGQGQLLAWLRSLSALSCIVWVASTAT